MVDQYFGELVNVRPQVVLEIKISDDNKTWRGYFCEPQAWPDDDISYGYIEVVHKYEDSTIPLVVKVFASHPKYLVWMVNLGVVLDKYLKLSDGNPPPNIPVWTLIPDEGYNRYLVELWNKGYSAKEIYSRLYISERTIYNRIHELRKKYGENIVPLRNKSRNSKKSVNSVN